jgi:hypothetical protein
MIAIEKTITVFHRLMLTMIDGKVCQALTNTPSSLTCVVCLATPRQMKNLTAAVNGREREETFK